MVLSALGTTVLIALPQVVADSSARSEVPKLAPAEPDQGVSLWFDLQAEGPRRCEAFESFADVILDLRLRTVGDGVKRLVIEGGAERLMATPLLFDLELRADDGTPLALPTFTLGTNFSPDEDRGNLLSFAHVQELGPEEVAMQRVRLAEWSGWSGIELAPDAYRMRVVYRGAPPAPPAASWVEPHYRHLTTGTWRGAARSQELRFTITGGEPPLDWSEPQDGLRVAARVRPSGRFLLGDEVRPRFLVENVSDHTLQFVRAVGSSQEDEVTIVAPGLGERPQRRCLCSGWYPVVTWTLPPKSRVWIDAAPIRTTIEEFPTPGTYSIRQRLCLRDGLLRPGAAQQAKDAELAALHARKWNDALVARPFSLELLARE